MAPFFKRGKMKNVTQADFFCKACVEHHQCWDLNAPVDVNAGDAEKFAAHEKSYEDACKATGPTRGEKFAMAAHILGKTGSKGMGCKWASAEAKTAALALCASRNGEDSVPSVSMKRSRKDSSPGPAASEQRESKQPRLMTYTALHMPFGKEETKAFQDQALRAVISANLPFSVFENPEVKVLFGMAQTTAPVKLPSGKVVAGRLLTKAVIGSLQK
ncbi:hypothetical protein C8J56DRAFT_1067910 [Mycena floridula]|nr:hypothetical protein C8J56DRAFT_1067910 [Mycena floridula]